jgi:hypothetical protein
MREYRKLKLDNRVLKDTNEKNKKDIKKLEDKVKEKEGIIRAYQQNATAVPAVSTAVPTTTGQPAPSPYMVPHTMNNPNVNRPAGRNTAVNIPAGGVLGDLDFDSRPRLRCVIDGCSRNTRRVCPTCRAVRVCQHHNTCGC